MKTVKTKPLCLSPRSWLPALIVPFFLVNMALAQGYPERPVRFIVGLPPGGGVDFIARVLAQKLTEEWSQPVVVENRAGANQIIATELVAKSKPDGLTVLIVNPAYTVNPTFYPKLPYNTLSDFDPVTLLAQYPFLLIAHPALPTRNIKELISVAKGRPGELSYGSSGIGSAPHLGMELFKTMTGVSIVHVPYKGAGPAVTDLVSGEVQVMLLNLSPVRGLLQSGRLRALAVASAARSSSLPNVPTASESGLRDFNYFGWYGMVLPVATPRAIRAKLHADVVKTLRTQDVRERLSVENTEPVGNTPEEFADFLQKEIAKFAAVIKKTGIKVH
ncbi:MAG: tripartite tricarboxylate transporter substrate binding protein [Betaproteobacteria bacterium]|nr:tripartite tricarboxylate transporter substrate binding protein [Betaproteobacteria bacterium]